MYYHTLQLCTPWYGRTIIRITLEYSSTIAQYGYGGTKFSRLLLVMMGWGLYYLYSGLY
jgi:hypothetical protein